MFTKPALYILYAGYTLVYIAWTLSLLITLALAERVHVKRLHVSYCYIGRLPFALVEIIWYAMIFERIERGSLEPECCQQWV